MTTAERKKSRAPAAERARHLREQLDAPFAADPDDPLERDRQDAIEQLEAAERELAQLVNEHAGLAGGVGHPDYAVKAAAVDAAKAKLRAIGDAAGDVDRVKRAELGRDLRRAERAAAREARDAQTRMTEAARKRAATDPRTVEHAHADSTALAGGLCRVLLDDDPDLRTAVEQHLGGPLDRGEHVFVAVGNASERRADDRRAVTAICTLRSPVSTAMIVLPLDRLERLPDGMRAR